MKTFTCLLFFTLMVSATADAQYCMLPGRTSYASNQPGITNFKLNAINRTSLCVENGLNVPPVVVTTDSTTLQRGQTYTVTLTHSKDVTSFPNARNNIRVWIDYNNNMSFDDAGETVITSDLQTPGVFSATFTVPATAPLGTVRLRATAKMSADAGHSLPSPCDMPQDPLGYHGEMEDYKVKILPATGISGVNATALNVSVYPNPASGQVTVSLNAVEDKPVTISLYDITGKLTGSLLNEAKQTATSYSFNLNNYITAKGVYFLKVSVGEAQSYQKLIKID